jgi:hypothetical protein
MLTELCGYLKNWFVDKQCYGNFKIVNGVISYADGTELPLQDGQYFRIVTGSIYNLGVITSFQGDSNTATESPDLKDEEFTGCVWTMAVPQDVIALANDIKAWRDKYEGVDSPMMSPYNSESFGGYSYSKSSGSTADGSNGSSWQSVFANRLTRYRKV